MTEVPRMNDIYRKMAVLEGQVNKLEHGIEELDNVVDPTGWISEAFDRVHEDIETVDQEIKECNRKLDIILQHITGMNQDSD